MGNWNLKEVIVIDLESTCWPAPQEQDVITSEIIEIGVCVLDALTGEIRKPQGIIVKPRHSKISPFCTELTSITQEMVDEGVSFEKAIKMLRMEYGTTKRMMGGYGNYDQKMLATECDRHGIKPPFHPTYLNISAMATLKLKAGKKLGLKNSVDLFGLQFEGRQHRGVDDAVMASKVLWECIK